MMTHGNVRAYSFQIKLTRFFVVRYRLPISACYNQMSKSQSKDMEDHLFQFLSLPGCTDPFCVQKITLPISFCKAF